MCEDKDLLQEAFNALDEYNPEEDMFTLILSKGAKLDNPDKTVPFDQLVLGEIGINPTVTFMCQAVNALSEMIGVSPYDFLCRHVITPFVEAEKMQILAKLAKEAEMSEDVEDVEDNPFDNKNLMPIVPGTNVEN